MKTGRGRSHHLGIGISSPEGEQGDKRNELTETENQHFMALLKVVFKNETKNHKVKFIFPYSFSVVIYRCKNWTIKKGKH